MPSKPNAKGFVSDWTPFGLDPSADFIHGYKGERGGRVTDWSAIRRGLDSGEIKTDVGRMMADWTSKDGKISKRMGPEDFEQGTLGEWLGVNWRTGNINPASFQAPRVNADGSTPEDNPGPRARLDSLAKYIGAVNTRLNMKDRTEDTAHLEEEIDALNTNRKRQKDFESALKGSGGVRYKRALMGSLNTNRAAGVYSGFAVDSSGNLFGFPAPDPPTAER